MLTLHTILELVAPSRARRALLTVLSRVPALFCGIAHTLSTDTLTVTRADLARGGICACLIGCQTVAGGSCPFAEALALATNTGAMIGSRTQLVIVTIAGEVVALAVLARNDLRLYVARLAVTHAAHTITLVTALGRRGVISCTTVQVTGRFTVYIGAGWRK